MEAKIFYIAKSSGTSADTLLAVGFASLLGYIHREVHGTEDGIFINDPGSYYEIILPLSLDTANLPKLRDMPVLLPLDSEKQREKQTKKGREGKLDGFDYDAEKNKSISYRERLKNLPPYLQTADARLRREPELEEIIPDEPNTRLRHYEVIIDMIVADSFNELALRWRELTEEQMQFHIDLLFKLFSNSDNNVTDAEVAWKNYAKGQKILGKACVSALQIINSTTGKGANYAKASELIGAIGNQDSFWLLELLKFVGFMNAAAPLIMKESKDHKFCKIYVLQPQRIELNQLQHMMHEFRAILWPTSAVKLDIIASLRLAQLFVKHHQRLYRYHKRRRTLSSIAQGFEVAFYKYLSRAYVTMNIASINLPEWLPDMGSLENAKAAEELLKEHLEIIQHIRNNKVKGEEGSEEYELLRFYRDFLSGRDLKPFWKFTTAYSSYLISQHEREKIPQRQIRPFTTTGLESIIEMNTTETKKKLTDIITNEGFRRIAYAIRLSTITAQYRRTQSGERTNEVRYEVRYGLGQELMREAHYPDKFIAALSRFLHQYNAETAREEEKLANKLKRALTPDDRRIYKLRGSVSYTDIDAIVQLIDDFGSEQVCSLLVAYGYAREPRKSTESNTADIEISVVNQEVIEEPAPIEQ
jgi:hypothetical protein